MSNTPHHRLSTWHQSSFQCQCSNQFLAFSHVVVTIQFHITSKIFAQEYNPVPQILFQGINTVAVCLFWGTKKNSSAGMYGCESPLIVSIFSLVLCFTHRSSIVSNFLFLRSDCVFFCTSPLQHTQLLCHPPCIVLVKENKDGGGLQ